MIIPIVISCVIGGLLVVLSIATKKKSTSNDGGLTGLFSSLMLLGGIGVIAVGVSFGILKSKGWSEANMHNFLMIGTIVGALLAALLGVKIIKLNANHGNNPMVKTGSLVWIILWLIVGIYGYKVIDKAGQGWNEERRNQIINVAPLKYDPMCYLNETMKMFPNPDDYNNMSEEKRAELDALLDENCDCCKRVESGTEEVEGLPDDF